MSDEPWKFFGTLLDLCLSCTNPLMWYVEEKTGVCDCVLGFIHGKMTYYMHLGFVLMYTYVQHMMSFDRLLQKKLLLTDCGLFYQGN